MNGGVSVENVGYVLWRKSHSKLLKERESLNAPNTPLNAHLTVHPENRVRLNEKDCPSCEREGKCFFHVCLEKYLDAVKKKKVEYTYFTRKQTKYSLDVLTGQVKPSYEYRELVVIAMFVIGKDLKAIEFAFAEDNKNNAFVTLQSSVANSTYVIPVSEALELLKPIRKRIKPILESFGLI